MIADSPDSPPTAVHPPSTLSYAIVTPARNGRDSLMRVADSVRAQQHRPDYWVIVDDDSDDGMREVADELARQHDWILVVGTGEGDEKLPNGRLRGRELLAFGTDFAPCPRRSTFS